MEVTDGPVVGDAFGVMLSDCLRAGAAAGEVLEFIERDDGYIDAADAARYFAPPEEWSELERWACEQARGRVLDVGSGAGRHSLYLQDRGLDVTALDVSPLASEVCRRRGVRRTFTGSVYDLASASPEPFDTFVLFGNNLGLLGSAEETPRLLDALARLSAPSARAIGQGMDPYATESPYHREYHERNRRLGRMGGQVRIRVRHRNLATQWFDYLFATLDELRALLEPTPWRLGDHRAEGASYVAILERR